MPKLASVFRPATVPEDTFIGTWSGQIGTWHLSQDDVWQLQAPPPNASDADLAENSEHKESWNGYG